MLFFHNSRKINTLVARLLQKLLNSGPGFVRSIAVINNFKKCVPSFFCFSFFTFLIGVKLLWYPSFFNAIIVRYLEAKHNK